MRSDSKLYWGVQWVDGDITVMIYHGIDSRKRIESAYKNKMISKIIGFYHASCREEAERIVRIKLGIIENKL